MKTASLTEETISVRIRLSGDVQGSGIRPAVARLAMQHQLQGYIRNCRRGVEISAIGSSWEIEAFRESLCVLYSEAEQSSNVGASTDEEKLQSGFRILESNLEGAAHFVVPLDRVICPECLQECMTPGNRRFGYALNSCSQCGPRYSIITAMPYDRSRTSMFQFPMCRACAAEYTDSSHRRFHAQTNCCLVCGPKIWFESKGEGKKEYFAAIDAAAQAMCAGQILALKGVGGYQLVCDATDEAVVARLRVRKGRSSKPLAVMIGSLEAAHALARIDSIEEAALRSSAGPIVIVESKRVSGLAPNVHPGLSQVGVMLPTSALHALLLKKLKSPLVVTSGNRDGEPLEYREAEAWQRLDGVADCVLHHNRPIVRPIDDSVVRCMAGRQVTIRAARGLAPMPVDCDVDTDMLALGGQQKTAIALSNGHTALLGPHVGDLNSILSRERYSEQQIALVNLMNGEPKTVVRDQHPDYFTSLYAEDLSANNLEAVQHHHAHVVSAMVEHGWLDREVLGLAFDGTGLGSDGTIWGGEVLLSNACDFERVAHLRPFRLAGGEAAIGQPWRVAIALLVDAFGEKVALDQVGKRLAFTWKSDEKKIQAVTKLLNSQSLSPVTTSMGRLFDGVAAIVCGVCESSFEGEAAMRLEAACIPSAEGFYAFTISDALPIELDWRPMVRELVSDVEVGLGPGEIAMKFHRAIANCVVRLAQRFPHLPLVLTGGVFQNRILVELVQALFKDHPSLLGLPGRIPPNDGGLAVGQLAVAASRRARDKSCV